MVLTSSEADQYSSTPKEISKLPLMYMTGYFCRSVYIRGCTLHGHVSMMNTPPNRNNKTTSINSRKNQLSLP